MAKIAIISDIHGNYFALQRVFQDMEKRGITELICLGDIVNKIQPRVEIITPIKEKAIFTLKGNCEDEILLTKDKDKLRLPESHLFKKDISKSRVFKYRFVTSQMGLENVRYISSLSNKASLLISGSIVTFFHATPFNNIDMFNPLLDDVKPSGIKKVVKDPSQMLDQDDSRQRISIYGHTHMDYIGEVKGDKVVTTSSPEGIILPKDRDIIMNAGSVGLPNIPKKDESGNFYLSNELSYLIIEGDLDSSHISDIKVELVHLPFVEDYLNAYFDQIRLNNGRYTGINMEYEEVLDLSDTIKKMETNLYRFGVNPENERIKRGL